MYFINVNSWTHLVLSVIVHTDAFGHWKSEKSILKSLNPFNNNGNLAFFMKIKKAVHFMYW